MVQNYPPRVGILGLSAVILLILSAPALASTGVAIKDVISEDLVVNERMSVTLIQTNLTDIRIYLPPGAGKIQVDGEVIPYKNNLMVIPVSCSTCVINITYTLPPESISWHTDDMFLQRTLDLPFPMDSLQYQAVLPRGSVIKEFQGEAPVAPAPSSIRTDGQHIIIIWKQANPEFPKNYIVHFLGEENIETTQEGYVQEFSEWHVWVLLLFSLIIAVLMIIAVVALGGVIASLVPGSAAVIGALGIAVFAQIVALPIGAVFSTLVGGAIFWGLGRVLGGSGKYLRVTEHMGYATVAGQLVGILAGIIMVVTIALTATLHIKNSAAHLWLMKTGVPILLALAIARL